MYDGDDMMVIYLEHGNGADKSKSAGEHDACGGTCCGLESAKTIIVLSRTMNGVFGRLDRNTHVELYMYLTLRLSNSSQIIDGFMMYL